MLRYRPPAKDRALLLYERFIRKSKVELEIGETPAAFAQRAIEDSPLSDDAIESITESYLDARYGPHERTAMQRLEKEITALR